MFLAFGDVFHQGIPEAHGLFLKVGRYVLYSVITLGILEDEGLHRQKVHQPFEGLFLPDGEVKRCYLPAEGLFYAFQSPEKSARSRSILFT